MSRRKDIDVVSGSGPGIAVGGGNGFSRHRLDAQRGHAAASGPTTGVLAAAEGEVSAALWNRDPSHDIATVLEQKPVMGPVPDEQQGEAIAFDDDGLGYVTTNEGTNRYLHEYRAPEE